MNTQSEFERYKLDARNLQFSICNFQFVIPLPSLRLLASMLFTSLCVFAPLRESSAQEPGLPQRRMQQPPSGTSGQGANGNVLFSTDEDYRIGVSDVLEVQVEDAPELTGTWRVNSAGCFVMKFVGTVNAQGKTIEDVQRYIADKLRGEYLTNPQVSVMVKQYNSRAVYVQGAGVRSPGIYQIEGHPSILQIITMAGGLADNCGSTAFIIREIKRPESRGQMPEDRGRRTEAGGSQPDARASSMQPPASSSEELEPEYDLKKVNINNLLRGNFAHNVAVEPGDIINIPQNDIFFVAGEVRSPGAFPLKEGTTLRQAISLAQGTTFKAAASRGLIFREDPATGKRNELKVDINQVMAGKQEDITIMANDIVVVPNSQFKSVTSVLLTGLGTTTSRIPIPIP